jgi:sugar phosphate permease
MLMKTSIVVAGPTLLADPMLQLTKADWGLILGWGTFGGILGKFLSGWCADRFGGKIVFTCGLACTTLGITTFSFRYELVAFAGLYSLMLMANASGWPSMAKLIGNWFQPNQYGRVWSLISTASRIGTITATFTVGALLQKMEWRQMLLVSASVGFSLFLMAWLFIREQPAMEQPGDGRDDKTESSHKDHPFYQLSLNQAARRFWRDKRFLLITLSMMMLTILWDFLNFVPIYLNEVLKLDTASAATATSSFPIGSLISMLFSGFFFDKWSRKTVTRLIGLYLSVAVFCLLLLLLMPQMQLLPESKISMTLGILFLFGFTVSPAYYLPMSIFAIRFGGPHSGFLIALLDALGYGASIAFSFFGSRLLMLQNGWMNFLSLLIFIATIGVIVTVWFLHNESKHAP